MISRALLSSAALTCASIAGAARAEEFRFEQYHTSKAHPRVILAPRNSGTATIRIQFNAGSYDDEAQQGITRLSQQAILSANYVEPYERFVVDLFSANADVTLETGVRECTFTLTAPAKDFEPLARRFAAMILAPKIAEERLEDAKSRTVTSRSSTPHVLVTILARTVISEPGFSNDPDGDRDQIRAMTEDDVSEYIRRRLPPANATVIVTGRFNAGTMKATLARFQGGTPTKRPRPTGELAGNYHQRTYLEMHIVAYPIELNSPEAIAAAHLSGALLTERLQRQFRRQGIAYWASAFPVHREWFDGLIVALPIHSDRDLPVTAQLNKEIEKVGSGKLIGDEFERNKSYLLEHLREVDRDSVQLADELGMGAGDVEWMSPKIIRSIRAMTQEQFTAKIGSWLDEGASIHAEFSPRSTASSQRRGRR
jgi:predicted Zn-dependent peptidase